MARITRMNFGGVNCYLVAAADGFVMIDTGPPERRAAVEAAVDRAGCRSGDLRLIVITHGDFEHAGNALHLRERYGAKIAMHRDDAARLELGDWRVGFKPRPDRVSWIFKEVSRLMATGDFETFEPDIFLEDGQSLRDYGLDATVVHLLGPTSRSLGILMIDGEPARGDSKSGVDRSRPQLFIDDMSAARASLERLLELGVRTVHPGHGKPFLLERVRGAPAGPGDAV